MQELTTSLMILGMFILRLGVPLAVTALVGYLLSRVDARWQAEAQARREASPVFQAALRSLPPAPEALEACWQARACTPEMRRNCPAAHSDDPCWIARFREEGKLPAPCSDCELFVTARLQETLPPP